jgi:hypothetical protein
VQGAAELLQPLAHAGEAVAERQLRRLRAVVEHAQRDAAGFAAADDRDLARVAVAQRVGDRFLRATQQRLGGGDAARPRIVGNVDAKARAGNARGERLQRAAQIDAVVAAQRADHGADVVQQLVRELGGDRHLLAHRRIAVAMQARQIELERGQLVAGDVVQFARELQPLLAARAFLEQAPRRQQLRVDPRQLVAGAFDRGGVMRGQPGERLEAEDRQQLERNARPLQTEGEAPDRHQPEVEHRQPSQRAAPGQGGEQLHRHQHQQDRAHAAAQQPCREQRERTLRQQQRCAPAIVQRGRAFHRDARQEQRHEAEQAAQAEQFAAVEAVPPRRGQHHQGDRQPGGVRGEVERREQSAVPDRGGRRRNVDGAFGRRLGIVFAGGIGVHAASIGARNRRTRPLAQEVTFLTPVG